MPELELGELYEEFEQDMLRFGTSIGGSRDAAEDLVHETFLRAMAHLPLLGRLKRHQRRSWLFTTLKRIHLDEVAARQRRDALSERLGRWQATSAEDSYLLDDFSVLELVPPQHRALMVQRYVVGMTSREIGRQLGVPAATVRSRLHQATRQIRQRRGAKGSGPGMARSGRHHASPE